MVSFRSTKGGEYLPLEWTKFKQPFNNFITDGFNNIQVLNKRMRLIANDAYYKLSIVFVT
jgi:hypothetical protein